MTDIKTQADAAFAIEFARNAAIRAIAEASSKELAMMAWQLGYVKGQSDAYQNALEMTGATK